MDTDDTVVLARDEALALAWRLVAQRAGDADWLLWEDVPMLSEKSFERLCAAVQIVASNVSASGASFDRARDVDSAALLEAAR